MPKPTLPPGRYETLIAESLREQLDAIDEPIIEAVDSAEAPALLATYLSSHIERALRSLGSDHLEEQWALVNEILASLISKASKREIDAGDLLGDACEMLRAIRREKEGLGSSESSIPPDPGIPLSLSELLINARGEKSVGAVLKQELKSADSVDLLCSFLKWSGFRLLRESLQDVRDRGGRIRVLSTAYCGATDPRVLDELQSMGAEVRVSLDVKRTRLHAKAWLLHRDSGFSTAFIGSSNMSAPALVDGLEWNVRVSSIENSSILNRFETTFESYWEDREFQDWSSALVHERFHQIIEQERGGSRDSSHRLLGIDIRPYPFQEHLLEQLETARAIHGRHKNLVVAATGTGKTMVAAFDYDQICDEHRKNNPGTKRPSLLFVAHRKEILEQSQMAFREVLKDASFGERLGGGEVPKDGRFVFANVQSLTEAALSGLSPDSFDVIIVDEFHHAQAASYQRVLKAFCPQELLGLTATPERTDNHWVQDTFFDGIITAELRLWDALERNLLVPFQYFATADPLALGELGWKTSGYDTQALSKLYTGNDIRARLIERQIRDKVTNPDLMRALGFCVTVDHAQFMAKRFVEFGYRAEAVWGAMPKKDRANAIRKIRSGELQIVFAVDLFNEGVDIPELDTLLLLRPTQSAIVFQQQLGRGLRQSKGKECLTVLDFVGQAHQKYSWASIFRSITGGSVKQVESMVAEDFPTLPAGCAMTLDRQSKEYVLENIRNSTKNHRVWLAQELRSLGADLTLTQFLQETESSVEDVYERSGRSWSELRIRAGFLKEHPQSRAWKAVARLRAVDDPCLLNAWLQILETPSGPLRAALLKPAAMLASTLLGTLESDAPELLLACLSSDEVLCCELRSLFNALLGRVSHVPISMADLLSTPLQIHCNYSLDHIMAAFGIDRRPREGVFYKPERQADLLFVTLQKSEKEYSPRTMYKDYAISSQYFHWESQNRTSPESPTGRRYIKKDRPEIPTLLFIRKTQKGRGNETEPYMLAGPVSYVKHVGSRPMQITWSLDHPLPGDWFKVARVAAC